MSKKLTQLLILIILILIAAVSSRASYYQLDDGSRLATAAGVISGANTDTFDVTFLPSCVRVTQSFFVGFLLSQQDGQYPAALDESNPLPGAQLSRCRGLRDGNLANLNNDTLLPLSDGTVTSVTTS